MWLWKPYQRIWKNYYAYSSNSKRTCIAYASSISRLLISLSCDAIILLYHISDMKENSIKDVYCRRKCRSHCQRVKGDYYPLPLFDNFMSWRVQATRLSGSYPARAGEDPARGSKPIMIPPYPGQVRVRQPAKQDRSHGDRSIAGLSVNDSALSEWTQTTHNILNKKDLKIE